MDNHNHSQVSSWVFTMVMRKVGLAQLPRPTPKRKAVWPLTSVYFFNSPFNSSSSRPSRLCGHVTVVPPLLPNPDPKLATPSGGGLNFPLNHYGVFSLSLIIHAVAVILYFVILEPQSLRIRIIFEGIEPSRTVLTEYIRKLRSKVEDWDVYEDL